MPGIDYAKLRSLVGTADVPHLAGMLRSQPRQTNTAAPA